MEKNTQQTLKNDVTQVKWRTLWIAHEFLEKHRESIEKVTEAVHKTIDMFTECFNKVANVLTDTFKDLFKVFENLNDNHSHRLSTTYPQNVNNFVNRKVNTKGYAHTFTPKCRSSC